MQLHHRYKRQVKQPFLQISLLYHTIIITCTDIRAIGIF